MEQIIEFITSNLLFVIFLLWAVLGIFKRKGSEEQQEKRKQGQNRNPRPVAQPIEMPWDRIEEEEFQQQQHQASIERERRGAVEEPILAYEKNPVQEPEPSRPAQRRPERTNRPHIEENKGTQAKLSEVGMQSVVDFKRINATNVVQGVIWSQVLGKPRSKEPHRTFGRVKRY